MAMSKDALRMSTSAICAVICVICPTTIVWFGCNYGYDRLASDNDFRSWRVDAVNALFWVAFLATGGFIVSMRRWWWLAALFALPLLGIAAVLAVTGAMWLDGTYF